jgi:hypothetical protein
MPCARNTSIYVRNTSSRYVAMLVNVFSFSFWKQHEEGVGMGVRRSMMGKKGDGLQAVSTLKAPEVGWRGYPVRDELVGREKSYGGGDDN